MPVVWPRGDEVMNNLSQVVICQDEVESPCQLRMTENIIHGHSHVRGIQKYSKNQATIRRCELLSKKRLSQGKLQTLQNTFSLCCQIQPSLLPCLALMSCHRSRHRRL